MYDGLESRLTILYSLAQNTPPTLVQKIFVKVRRPYIVETDLL